MPPTANISAAPKVHSKTATRASPMGKGGKDKQALNGAVRRPTLRPVLDSPYRTLWPLAPAEAVEWREELVRLLTPVGDRKRLIHKEDAAAHAAMVASKGAGVPKKKRESTRMEMPWVLRHLTIGLSATSRATSQGNLLAIICCRDDTQPAQLVGHIPGLARLAQIPLVVLPIGSAAALATAMGIPRTIIIGIKSSVLDTDTEGEGVKALVDLAKHIVETVPIIPPLSQAKMTTYLPTHVSLVRSTAPVLSKKNPQKIAP